MFFMRFYCVVVGVGIRVGSKETDAFTFCYRFVCGNGVARFSMYILKGVGRFKVCCDV